MDGVWGVGVWGWGVGGRPHPLPITPNTHHPSSDVVPRSGHGTPLFHGEVFDRDAVEDVVGRPADLLPDITLGADAGLGTFAVVEAGDGRERAFQRLDHLGQPDLRRVAHQRVAALWPAHTA